MSLDDLIAIRYQHDRSDEFDGTELDTSLWLPHHLPHWSSREDSAARYRLGEGALHLVIDANQGPWCREFDGATRVSSFQTGLFAGPVGGPVGQHRFNPAATVREAQRNVRLYTPRFGAFAVRARALDDPACMVAFWMIGYEDKPERSAEICVCEIFGRNVSPRSGAVGMGIHPFGDPTLVEDFEEVRLPIDVREVHEYAAEWRPDGVTFFVDGRAVRTVHESPQYAMQFMLGIYEFGNGSAPDRYPKRFTVESFRAYRPVA